MNNYSSINRKFLFILISLYLMASGCKKFVSVDPPRHQLVTPEVFKDSANATSAIVGIYIKIMNSSTSLSFGNGAITLLTGLSGDELYASNATPDEADFFTNSISSMNEKNRALWTSAYPVLYQINACLEGLTDNNSLSENLRKQLIGEAKFMRAFFYFNLIQLFGDVPLVTSTAYIINATLPRTATDQIYLQIIDDLTKSEQLLSSTYPTNARIRPNKYSAIALLSRVYLYRQEWQKAEDEATKVISSGLYTLESDLNRVFLATSNEAILQWRPIQPGYETAEGQSFIPGTSASSLPKYVITSQLFNSFESADLRKQKWTKTKTVSGTAYAYPFKYKLAQDNNTTPVENYMILRLAEQYLIRAEARINQNKVPAALSDLNSIRLRAALVSISSNDQAVVANAIEQERKLELFTEWGHRWFDLKRLNKATIIFGPVKAPNWQSSDQLYPIPFYEIQANPALSQNPGY